MRINGELMSKDKVIGKVVNSRFEAKNAALLPLFFKRTPDIEGWLEGRAIDRHRTNSRLLKKALRLAAADDLEVVLRVNAATITDTYWFRPEGSTLTYQDIQFKENMFDKLALYGDPDSFNREAEGTPELTNIGSFEKCWSLIDGHWYLYKAGNENELFSELFICKLGKALGMNMAEYEKDGTYIRSRDFTNGASVNFEPAEAIVGEEEDYTINLNALDQLSEEAAKDYIKMIYLDTVCFNMDRHTKNYGVLRDTETGEILGLAPNFDNNIALIARGYPKDVERKNDKLIQLFIDFLNQNQKAVSYFNEMRIPEITEKMIEECIDKTGFPVDRKYVVSFIRNGEQQIKARFLEMGLEGRQGHEL